MKVCSTCKQPKPLEAFNKKSANADGRERYCKECHRARNRTHYDGNKHAYKTSARRFKHQLIDWFQSYKATLHCVACGETKPWRLAFHHRDPAEKDVEVSVMVANHRSRECIMREVEKCDVVCHICHSDIHHEQNRSLV